MATRHTIEAEHPVLTPREVAAMFGVDTATVTRWAPAGRLPSFRTPGGHRRYRVAAVEAALNGGRPADDTGGGADDG